MLSSRDTFVGCVCGGISPPWRTGTERPRCPHCSGAGSIPRWRYLEITGATEPDHTDRQGEQPIPPQFGGPGERC
jgi:hypothetical protein